MATQQQRYAAECQFEYANYRRRCKATSRGDGIHHLWVKLAWENRKWAREWLMRD